jgi:hexosaminidase
VAVLPQPVLVDTSHQEVYHLAEFKSYYSDFAGIDDVISYLDTLTGIALSPAGKQRDAQLSVVRNDSIIGSEAYRLTIKAYSIEIEAGTLQGAFRGMTTLCQLILQQPEPYLLQTVIEDQPVYGYRGMMLDVARHFFPKETVLALIDQIALYKINHLHLHLSDDQGWRIEIKSWPKLTEIGGSTQVGGGSGGYFTQQDYKDIVDYAASRFITIIPEIDMPGHTNAALASYPELNCDGKATRLYTGMRVGFSSFCVDKEITYEFIDDVVTEIAAISPGPYFHIGGDESHATDHDDYFRFVNRVSGIVQRVGKTMIGWDEIATASIDSNTVVQFWRNDRNAKLAIDKGAQIIMSPAFRAYLDMKYDSTTALGLTWAGDITPREAYEWSLTGYSKSIEQKDILGIEAPLWSETIENLSDIQYLTFPRLTAYAEIGWTPDSLRVWEDYASRLQVHYGILDSLNVNAYKFQMP